MAIRKTYFDNHPDGSKTYFDHNLKGNKTYFDFSYTDDSFPSDTQTDFDEAIKEMGKPFWFVRNTVLKDSYKRVIGVSKNIGEPHNNPFLTYGAIMDISNEDRNIHDMGLAVSGNRKGYFNPYYYFNQAKFEIKVNDIMKDTNGDYWKVIKIVGEPILSKTAPDKLYKKIIVQKTSNKVK